MTVRIGAELPLMAVERPSIPDPKQKYMIDRYQKGAYTDAHKSP